MCHVSDKYVKSCGIMLRLVMQMKNQLMFQLITNKL